MDSRTYLATMQRLGRGSLGLLGIWAEDHAIPWIRSEMEGIVAKKLPVVPDQQAIRSGLAVSLADLVELPKKASYWGAQLVMFEREARRYARPAIRFSPVGERPYKDATERELREGLIRCLRDGVLLLERAGTIKLDLAGAYGVWGAGQYSTFPMFKAAEQMTYGRYSGLTHADEAAHASIAILRTAIELRMRRAFGVQSFVNLKTGELTPISFSSLMEKVLAQARHIRSQVDLHDLNLVYRWTNPYLHAGRRDYAWTAGFCLQYLRLLFVGPDKLHSRRGWSVHGGLELPQVVFDRVRRPFEKAARKDVRLFPMSFRPECVIY